MGLPDCPENFKIDLDTIPACNRRTDRRTPPHDSKDRAMQSGRLFTELFKNKKGALLKHCMREITN